MSNLRVLFYVYPSAFQNPGGGEIQLLMTKKYLETQGVTIKLFDQWQDKLEDYHILHVFGSVKECNGLIATAKAKGLKIALSTIFWSTWTRALYAQGSCKERMRLMVQHLAKVLVPWVPSGRKKMCMISDILLPNSESEAAQIARYFHIPKDKFFVVPNGVEERFASADPSEFVTQYGLRDFILCVGRIEPRKNQLNVIEATRSVDVPLVLIGDAVSEYQWYYDLCRKKAHKNVYFLGHMGHETTLLESAYAACKVFCLAGWFETPGLAALEAGLAGAHIVITRDGSTRDYFKDMAYYIKPQSIGDIRQQIEKALILPKNRILSEYIKTHYLWGHAATKTKEAYEGMMGKIILLRP